MSINRENRKEYYQGVVDELIKQHGEDKFTYRLFGEKLGFTKQRAKQLIDYFQLKIPTHNYFGSTECADLKKLIQSNQVGQYTFQEIYEERYKKLLPKKFIRSLVASAGKTFAKSTDKALYGEFLSKTKTEDKTKQELFADLKAMFPGRVLNYSSFCSDLNKRRLPFKRKRRESLGNKNLVAKLMRENHALLIEGFVRAAAISPALYSTSQLHVLYEDYAKKNGKPSIDYLAFRKSVALNNVPVAKSKPLALLARLLRLGIDLKANSLQEIAEAHNAQFPLFPTIPKMLNDYVLKPHLGRD
ncbi:hypothetical protein [Ralstonia pseudosolanacearum]